MPVFNLVLSQLWILGMLWSFEMILHEDYFYGIPIHVMSMDGQLLIR